jgi:hypothetical protein
MHYLILIEKSLLFIQITSLDVPKDIPPLRSKSVFELYTFGPGTFLDNLVKSYF